MFKEIVRYALVLLFLYGAFWNFQERRVLKSRGISVNGQCTDRRWKNGQPNFVISFTSEDGQRGAFFASKSDVPSGFREGDEVSVRYDPLKIQRAQTEKKASASLWNPGLCGVEIFVAVAIWYAMR